MYCTCNSVSVRQFHSYRILPAGINKQATYLAFAIFLRSSGDLINLSRVLTMAENFGRCDLSFCQQSNINWWIASGQSCNNNYVCLSLLNAQKSGIRTKFIYTQQYNSCSLLLQYLPSVAAVWSFSLRLWWRLDLTSSNTVSHRTTLFPT